MTWCTCNDCGHQFTDGYFTQEAFTIVQSRILPAQQVGYEVERQREVAGRMVGRVAQYADGQGAWLDVGFGSGALLFAADEWGFEPVGIDLRTENVAALASLGIEACRCDITDLDHDGRYSVVSMTDVLEHLPFPKKGLESVRRLLKPGGTLLISTPNAGTVAWRMLAKSGVNPYMGEIEHYHNFSRKRLASLLNEFGFHVVSYAISERYRLGMEIVARYEQ